MAHTILAKQTDAESNEFNDFVQDVKAEILDALRSSSTAPQDLWQHWQAFSSAVDWQETWIRGLIAFHLIFALLFVIYRNNIDVQTVQFFLICLIVGLSERLNSWCALHWQLFSTQNYFDSSGVFTGLMLSAPLLLMAVLQLVSCCVRLRLLD